VFIEVFCALTSRQRMFGEMQLAEGEKLGSNILHVCPRNQANSHAIQRTALFLQET
jgi:hypothetical protein